MITTQEILEQLAGQKTADALVETMLTQIDDFRESHDHYTSAIRQLRQELGACVDEVTGAIDRQAASALFFSGVLGLKMNLDHFTNPMSPNCTWPQVDYGDYLRETTAHSLPVYRQAEAVLSDFRQRLTREQAEQFEAVSEYISHLETVGPKLAHYYGYRLGNDLLPLLVPGYHPDMALTIQYTTMLEHYFGKRLSIMSI